MRDLIQDGRQSLPSIGARVLVWFKGKWRIAEYGPDGGFRPEDDSLPWGAILGATALWYPLPPDVTEEDT